MTPEKQKNLVRRLWGAARTGDTEMVQTLLAAGADVHAWDDRALCYAANNGHTETVKELLAAGANVHAQDNGPLFWAAYMGRTKTVQVLARHIFAPDSCRGKSQTEIEAQAKALYDKMEAHRGLPPIKPERLRKAAFLLADCALTCWEQVRPEPPPINISPLPAQPRPL